MLYKDLVVYLVRMEKGYMTRYTEYKQSQSKVLSRELDFCMLTLSKELSNFAQ